MKTREPYHPRWPYVVTSAVVFSGILISAWKFIQNQNPGKTIAFTNVHLIPMTSEAVTYNQAVLLKGSEIAAIGAADTVKIPWGAQVIDDKGAYLMPGLADMHAHARISTNQWAQSWDDPEIWPVHPLMLYLANGVTTIRDLSAMDESGSYPLKLRSEIQQGMRICPTIYTAGEALYASPPRCHKCTRRF